MRMKNPAMLVILITWVSLANSQTTGEQQQGNPGENYASFSKWGLSFEYPAKWREHPAARVAAMKNYLAQELRPYGRTLSHFTMLVGPNDEPALLVSKYTMPKAMKPSEFIAERNKVYEDAKRAGDVTRVNIVRETTISKLPSVEEDVERSNGARGRTHKVINGLTVFEISFIVNNKQNFSKYSEFLVHLVSSLKVSTLQVVKDKAYQISIAPGWARTKSVPQGLDVGFRKQLAKGKYATLYFHHEVMPSLGEPPSDTSGMKRQWSAMIRNRYPDTRSVAGKDPNVLGTILINGTYELTDGGEKVRRRYTYFLAARTAFVVQCSAPPLQWQTVLSDFDIMLASLQPGSSSPKAKTQSDKSAIAEVKRNLPTLLGSFPTQWRCSLSSVVITPPSSEAERTLEVGLSFNRSDISEIYKGTKLLFGMMKLGKTGADLNSFVNGLPAETQRGASHGNKFVFYVGQVWGYAGGYVAGSCNPPIEWYKISIIGSDGKKIGSVCISRKDGSAILSDEVTVADTERIAGMYVFE